MDKIDRCLRKKGGIELVEPSENLSKAHILKAEEALQAMSTVTVRDWKLSAGYYAMYHGIYSILMRAGVKCEIHSCTLEFARRFLDKKFTEEDFKLVEKAFRARNDAQYYVNRLVDEEDYETIIRAAPGFLVKCKNTVLVEKEIATIRKSIEKRSKPR